MLTYNPENKTYSKLIPIEELEGMKEKMRAIEERLKNTRSIHHIPMKQKQNLILTTLSLKGVLGNREI